MIFKFKYLIIFSITLLISMKSLAAPEIILERPASETMTVYNSMVTFKGTVKEASTLSINGLSIPLKMGGQFEYEIKLNSKNGNNYFLLEASNGAETSQINRTIFYDESNSDTKKKETPREKVINNPIKMEKIISQKKQTSYSKELSKIDAIDALRSYIGKNTRGSMLSQK